MRCAVGLLAGLLFVVSAAGQEPVPVPKTATIDQLIVQITDLRAKRAEIEKQEVAATAELKSRFKELAERLEKLSLIDPPAPPVPPKPPVPPTPADLLKVKLKAAFDADGAEKKRDQAKDLAALYRQAATLTADPAVQTSGDLLTRVRAAAMTLVGTDSLKGVRSVAGAELALAMPTDAALTDEQRTAVAALFTKLATVIEEIAK